MGEAYRYAYNVREVMRVNGKDSIIVCARCGNEVESDQEAARFVGIAGRVLIPRYDFCPWCSATLRTREDSDGR